MNRWTFPFSPDPYCKISVRGNEDWTWEKASKSLTVIVVNSSPVPGSFIYCKSLHLPEPLTSKGFYWGPLGASLMCATIYFNINILHMYRNIYSKRWETDCFRRPGGFFFFFFLRGGGRAGALRVNNKELSDASEPTCRERPRAQILEGDFSPLHKSKQLPRRRILRQILCTTFHAWLAGRAREGESSTNDLQMENKNAGRRFFPDPICSPSWASLKVSFKTVICLLVWSSVTMSAGHLLGLVTCETVL